MLNNVAKWLSNLFVTQEEHYLSYSVDLADFERRQRLLEQIRHKNLLNNMYY
jgi:hypothetical protein